jgi:alpha-beta hydrolase superfamily lysophospholipase
MLDSPEESQKQHLSKFRPHGLAWLYTPAKRRADLEAIYARAPSQFLEIAGMRLHLRDTGPKAAPALILLHGFGSSLQTWDEGAHDLEADHRVIRYDLPGFGLTIRL